MIDHQDAYRAGGPLESQPEWFWKDRLLLLAAYTEHEATRIGWQLLHFLSVVSSAPLRTFGAFTPGIADFLGKKEERRIVIPLAERSLRTRCIAMTWVITRFTRYPTILAMLVSVGGFAPAQSDHLPKEGDPAPAFSITTDRGKRISPGVFGGNLLVLNFWETSCVPCVKEMPSLSDFARKFRSEQVVVVAVGGDEDAKKYRRFLRDHRMALETYRDPDRRISRSFGTYMSPETYLIRDGRIIRKVVGAIDWMSTDITAFVRAAAVKK